MADVSRLVGVDIGVLDDGLVGPARLPGGRGVGEQPGSDRTAIEEEVEVACAFYPDFLDKRRQLQASGQLGGNIAWFAP